jgi:hypothetical protein
MLHITTIVGAPLYLVYLHETISRTLYMYRKIKFGHPTTIFSMGQTMSPEYL